MKARLPLLLVVAALLVLMVVAARGTSPIPVLDRELAAPRPYVAPAPPGEPVRTNGFLDLISGVSTAVLLLTVLVMLLIGAAGILAALVGWRRGRVLGLPVPVIEGADGSDLPPGTTPQALLDGALGARAALSLRHGGPPGDAIVAAWVELERAAASGGSPRRAHQTPTEFTTAVLTTHAVDVPAMDRLRTLYLRARFGARDQVSERDADDAALALDRIIGTLGAGTR